MHCKRRVWPWWIWAPSKLLSHAQPMGGSRQEAVWWTKEITKEIARLLITYFLYGSKFFPLGHPNILSGCSTKCFERYTSHTWYTCMYCSEGLRMRLHEWLKHIITFRCLYNWNSCRHTFEHSDHTDKQCNIAQELTYSEPLFMIPFSSSLQRM